jgi:hypothetical protein
VVRSDINCGTRVVVALLGSQASNPRRDRGAGGARANVGTAMSTIGALHRLMMALPAAAIDRTPLARMLPSVIGGRV